MIMDAVMRWLHFLGVITWIGGMMFQMVALQPFLKAQALPARLPLLFPVIRRFLMMTWASITLLLISGSDMLIRVFMEEKTPILRRTSFDARSGNCRAAGWRRAKIRPIAWRARSRRSWGSRS